MTSPVVAVVIVAAVDVAADCHVPAGLSDPERSTVDGLSPSIREVIKSRGRACLFVCCVVELRRNGRRVSVTGLNRIHRHTSTRDTEFYGEQAQKPMCGSALVLARRGSVAGETVKSVRTHAFPMSVRTYAG